MNIIHSGDMNKDKKMILFNRKRETVVEIIWGDKYQGHSIRTGKPLWIEQKQYSITNNKYSNWLKWGWRERLNSMIWSLSIEASPMAYQTRHLKLRKTSHSVKLTNKILKETYQHLFTSKFCQALFIFNKPNKW